MPVISRWQILVLAGVLIFVILRLENLGVMHHEEVCGGREKAIKIVLLCRMKYF